MFPGMNPRKMQQMMKQMGIQQKELDAVEVIIRTKTEEFVFDHPQVSRVNMMGQETYQIVGKASVQSLDSGDAMPEISQEDVDAVVAQTNVSEERARKMLLECEGDIAAAIMKLQDA